MIKEALDRPAAQLYPTTVGFMGRMGKARRQIGRTKGIGVNRPFATDDSEMPANIDIDLVTEATGPAGTALRRVRAPTRQSPMTSWSSSWRTQRSSI